MYLLQTAADVAGTQYGGSVGPDLGRYLFVCTLILGTTIGLGFAFRRLIAETIRKKAAQRSMRVLDVLPLSGKGRLNVVRCYDRTFLLGVGDKEVSLICELDSVIGEETPAAVSRQDAPAFTSVLEALTKGEHKAASPPARRRLEEVVG